MPDYTITVSADAAKIIQRSAAQQGKTGREVVEQLVDNWANGQINGFFIEKLDQMTIAEKIILLGDIQ